ncbi:MAG: pseudouridine-5'-phosphate glycosidase [Anaerolineales bacterium]|jgi:pseudouridine-5'-phosphate glycosidase
MTRRDFTPPPWLTIEPHVAAALADFEPVVALESTVITHGLPRPANLEVARRMESEIQSKGALPATVGIYQGKVHLGLPPDILELLALSTEAQKVSRRDLSVAAAHGLHGGTTVSATMFIAHAAGVRVFATGGIGGVHRSDRGDVSTDLTELARTPIAVVCSGAKAILDLPRTLEWLETAGVPVLGWKTDEFPAFFSTGSGLPVSAKVESAKETAAILNAQIQMGLQNGVLICVPCPEESAVPWEQVDRALVEAEQEAVDEGVHGNRLTPFMLERLSMKTGGATFRSNVALLKHNARIAAEIAVALTPYLRRLRPGS